MTNYNSTYTGQQVEYAVKKSLATCHAVCGTAAGTAAKVATVLDDPFEPEKGARVIVTFINAVSVAGATLNINSTGAKPIYYRGAALAANKIAANDVIELVYDGSTSYSIVGQFDTTQYYSSSGGKLSGSVEIDSTGDAWNAGIRIHAASNNWAGIVLCEASNSGPSGTSANTWSMHNNEGTFGFYRNGSNTNATTYLSCVSNAWSTNRGFTAANIYASSDKRLKEDINKIDNIDLSTLAVYTYNFKADETKTKKIGLIAQEVQEIFPEAVSVAEAGTEHEHLSLDYNAIAALCVGKINELTKENTDLKTKLATIEAQLAHLEQLLLKK